MKKEKLIADEFQCMFLEGSLEGFNEEYINFITRKLRRGEVTIPELIRENPILKQMVKEATVRIDSLLSQDSPF